jgi:hypothetical protein
MMPKSTTGLVKELLTHLNRFMDLSVTFGPELQRSDLRFSISLSYSTLQIQIHQLNELYFQYTLQQGETLKVVPSDCYYHDQQKIETLKRHFELLTVYSVGDSSGKTPGNFTYTEELNAYLTIAESIATSAYLCTAGDDYRPGYFSEITVKSEGIMLNQINYMNSRSLDHKKNYSLRDLKIFIPLKPLPEHRSRQMDEYYIGTMRIHFSDRSSQNNRTCGDRILEKIEEEKLRFASN